MRMKLRRIHVDGCDFFWRVLWDPDAANGDYLFLRVWVAGRKAYPWLTVHYQFHNPWLFYGDIINAVTPEQQDRVRDYFQLKPLTPGKVAEIIRKATFLLNEEYSDRRLDKNWYLNINREGSLNWGLA